MSLARLPNQIFDVEFLAEARFEFAKTDFDIGSQCSKCVDVLQQIASNLLLYRFRQVRGLRDRQFKYLHHGFSHSTFRLGSLVTHFLWSIASLSAERMQMPRYKLLIEYHGASFVGWQMQENGVSVQGALALAITAFCGETVLVHGAGRTDAGVHALGQVAHVDFAKPWDADTVRDAINAHLRPHPVAVLGAALVGDDFDARFSATKRHYLYRIVNRRADLALDAGRAWRVARALDIEAMQAAAERLLGWHDFTTFRAAACQAKSPLKTLDRFEVECSGEEIRIHATARSFLHTQVRSMVGSLVEVGAGRWKPDDLAAALAARDRKACGPVAPAAGLYLVRVDY